MSAFGCLRALAQRPGVNAATKVLRAVTFRPSTVQSTRDLSILSPRRPVLPSTSTQTQFLPVPGATSPSTALTTTSETLDLLPRISAHPGLTGIQIRCGPRDTYNPSHFVRKRRHGWLSRIRTKKGRKLLMRRILKGRWNLSH